jgi:hypothetical protein
VVDSVYDSGANVHDGYDVDDGVFDALRVVPSQAQLRVADAVGCN